MIDYSNMKLIDIIRKSKKNKEILNTYFNPHNQCFSCLIISSMILRDACELKKINLSDILSKLS